MNYLILWPVFGFGYGMSCAANAPRETFKEWREQLWVIGFCTVFGPLVPIFQIIYRIYHW